jgi:tetraacyldisaccharide 4'-kinase
LQDPAHRCRPERGKHSAALVEALQLAWLTRGPLARAMLPLAAVYATLTAIRRAAYRRGWLRARTLPVPVVVVGNLVAGGAGKTPTVIAIVATLARRGYRPGIVSRGHGGSNHGGLEVTPHTPASSCGDEPLLLRLRTGVPVVVGHDRVAAAQLLLRLHADVDVLVCDDGLQHLRLGRDVEVIVFDERGAGNGWLLPAGPLREQVPRRLNVSSLVLYNAQSPTTPLAGHLASRRLAGVVSLQDWWLGRPASVDALTALCDRPLLAVAGTARPARFFAMLEAAGLHITAMPLPDHHDYARLPWNASAADVVLTEKDATKIDPARTGTTRVWVAALDFLPAAAFDAALLALLPPPSTSHGNATP